MFEGVGSMAEYVHNARFHVKSKCTHPSVHFAQMDFDDRPEPAKRLEQARVAKGIASAREAARRFGWKYDSYIQHENGTRGLSRAVSRYARAFGVSEAFLLTGDGSNDPNVTRVPIVSWIAAGALRRSDGVLPADIERFIDIANLGRGEWIALEVTGDSMNRVAPDGSVIVLDTSDGTLINDRYYVFRLEDGSATFKQWRREPQPMLRPYSTNLDHLAIPADIADLYVVGRVRRIITEV